MVQKIIITPEFDEVEPKRNLPGETYEATAKRFPEPCGQLINEFAVPPENHIRVGAYIKRICKNGYEYDI